MPGKRGVVRYPDLFDAIKMMEIDDTLIWSDFHEAPPTTEKEIHNLHVTVKRYAEYAGIEAWVHFKNTKLYIVRHA